MVCRSESDPDLWFMLDFHGFCTSNCKPSFTQGSQSNYVMKAPLNPMRAWFPDWIRSNHQNSPELVLQMFDFHRFFHGFFFTSFSAFFPWIACDFPGFGCARWHCQVARGVRSLHSVRFSYAESDFFRGNKLLVEWRVWEYMEDTVMIRGSIPVMISVCFTQCYKASCLTEKSLKKKLAIIEPFWLN